MDEQELEKLKLLLESSHERLSKRAAELAQDEVYAEAILRDQRPDEGEETVPRKIA